MYDTDVTVWSPQGRLLQVEYAMEAVKQGSACLGIVGSKYVVLAALKLHARFLFGGDSLLDGNLNHICKVVVHHGNNITEKGSVVKGKVINFVPRQPTQPTVLSANK